jgi:hypothetical protein
VTQGKIAEDSGIKKATKKTQIFDVKKERKILKEAKQEFKAYQGSSLET